MTRLSSSTNLCVQPTQVGAMTECTNANSTNGSDLSDDACVGNSFLRKSLEMELLEQRNFDDENGINENNDENK
jgi:hypothetical protein